MGVCESVCRGKSNKNMKYLRTKTKYNAIKQFEGLSLNIQIADMRSYLDSDSDQMSTRRGDANENSEIER